MPKGEIQDAVSITFDGFYLHMLSLSHLQTLSYFIEVLPDLRIQHLSNRLDTRKSCAYHGTVTASIFIAVAFLEAQINETLFDVHQRQIEIPDIAQRERLFSALQARLYERNADRWNCIDKYKFVLSTLERQELAKSQKRQRGNSHSFETNWSTTIRFFSLIPEGRITLKSWRRSSANTSRERTPELDFPIHDSAWRQSTGRTFPPEGSPKSSSPD
jgi:hypothetical protein